MSLRREQIVFFDLETTTDADKQIIEFGAIVVDPSGLYERESFSVLVRTDRKVSAFGVKINGITDAMLRDAPTFPEVCDHIYSVLDGRKWAGHNIDAFDIPILNRAFERAGRTPPKNQGTLDTYPFLEAEFGRRAGDLKLATLALYFGLGAEEHRALEDARLCLRVLKAAAAVLLLERSATSFFTTALGLVESKASTIAVPTVQPPSHRSPQLRAASPLVAPHHGGTPTTFRLEPATGPAQPTGTASHTTPFTPFQVVVIEEKKAEPAPAPVVVVPVATPEPVAAAPSPVAATVAVVAPAAVDAPSPVPSPVAAVVAAVVEPVVAAVLPAPAKVAAASPAAATAANTSSSPASAPKKVGSSWAGILGGGSQLNPRAPEFDADAKANGAATGGRRARAGARGAQAAAQRQGKQTRAKNVFAPSALPPVTPPPAAAAAAATGNGHVAPTVAATATAATGAGAATVAPTAAAAAKPKKPAAEKKRKPAASPPPAAAKPTQWGDVVDDEEEEASEEEEEVKEGDDGWTKITRKVKEPKPKSTRPKKTPRERKQASEDQKGRTPNPAIVKAIDAAITAKKTIQVKLIDGPRHGNFRTITPTKWQNKNTGVFLGLPEGDAKATKEVFFGAGKVTQLKSADGTIISATPVTPPAKTAAAPGAAVVVAAGATTPAATTAAPVVAAAPKKPVGGPAGGYAKALTGKGPAAAPTPAATTTAPAPVAAKKA